MKNSDDLNTQSTVIAIHTPIIPRPNPGILNNPNTDTESSAATYDPKTRKSHIVVIETTSENLTSPTALKDDGSINPIGQITAANAA